jgi:hypothetical protein
MPGKITVAINSKRLYDAKSLNFFIAAILNL